MIANCWRDLDHDDLGVALVAAAVADWTRPKPLSFPCHAWVSVGSERRRGLLRVATKVAM